MPGPQDPDRQIDERLQRLEEHVGEVEYQLDGLSQSLAELGKKLDSLSSAVRSVSGRIGKLEEPSVPAVPPPNSDQQ